MSSSNSGKVIKKNVFLEILKSSDIFGHVLNQFLKQMEAVIFT